MEEEIKKVALSPIYQATIMSPGFCATDGCLNKALPGSRYCLACLERKTIWRLFPNASILEFKDGRWIVAIPPSDIHQLIKE